jgi:hypothetical protein
MPDCSWGPESAIQTGPEQNTNSRPWLQMARDMGCRGMHAKKEGGRGVQPHAVIPTTAVSPRGSFCSSCWRPVSCKMNLPQALETLLQLTCPNKLCMPTSQLCRPCKCPCYTVLQLPLPPTHIPSAHHLPNLNPCMHYTATPLSPLPLAHLPPPLCPAILLTAILVEQHCLYKNPTLHTSPQLLLTSARV